MKELVIGALGVVCVTTPLQAQEENSSLFHDLELVEALNRKIQDELPFIYNFSFVGGYFTMPSARMAKNGTIALGVASVSPYTNFGLNFQPFEHLEIAGNYRIFNGITEQNFGHLGFGDDAERIGNFKLGVLIPGDGFPMLPSIAVGAEDFVGTRRFHSKYVVVTKSWQDANIEVTLGWGKGRIKGLFGGIAWSPFHQTDLWWLKNLSFIAEYDATNYKRHAHEHPRGRTISSRFNGGISYTLADVLQLSISSLRGEKVAASASVRYPLGSTKGLFPKTQDAAIYSSPIDTEALGPLRSQKEFAHELAYAFADQGLDLYSLYLFYNAEGKKELWMKVVNNRYREESVVRDRIEHLLASLAPSDIFRIAVVMEAEGLPLHSYTFRREDLVCYQQGYTGRFELETLSPMREVVRAPGAYDSTLLFHRKKKIWTFTLSPRLLTFFGSSTGKFKYSLGAIVSPEGYLFDSVYYKFQFSYVIQSSLAHLGTQDKLNPSKLINVRTDTLRYFQSNTVAMEQAFLQKGWNLGKGWFYRVAGGYFEPAYGGGATELLYWPVNSNFAVGAEVATVWKRKYTGLGFTNKIRKFTGSEVIFVPFLGVQYFLDLYYRFQPLNLEFKVSAGQFLAKDKGARFQATRFFKSGLRFSVWCTVTNGHDKVNGKTYFDQGFAFTIPFDIFLKQSSRNYIGYGMSVWLRDVGAQADTGLPLYYILKEERYNF